MLLRLCVRRFEIWIQVLGGIPFCELGNGVDCHECEPDLESCGLTLWLVVVRQRRERKVRTEMLIRIIGGVGGMSVGEFGNVIRGEDERCLSDKIDAPLVA